MSLHPLRPERGPALVIASAAAELEPVGEVLAGRRRWALVNRDCLQALAELPAGCVDHVITDPPYEAETHTKQRRLKGKTVRSGGGGAPPPGGPRPRRPPPPPLDFPAITEAEREEAGAHLSRVARRWCLVFSQVEATERWRAALTRSGTHGYVRTCIYVKRDPQPQLTGDRPGTGWEAFVVTHPPGRKRWNAGGRCGVFYSLGGGDVDRREGRSLHPTQKPTALAMELVEAFSDPGEVVLDPWAGSASFGAACLRLGRRYIGFELDPRYAAVAQERMQAEEQGLNVHDARAGQLPLLAPTTSKGNR